MTKRKLALAVALAAVGSMWMGTACAGEKTDARAAAEESLETYELEPVTVEGERAEERAEEGRFVARKGAVGILGEQDTMETPFTTTNIKRDTITSFGDPSQPLDSVLAVSPSVRATGSVLHNDFQLRGFRSNGSSSYVNGIPDMFTQFNAPLYVIESVDIVSGPNSGLSANGTHYESNAAGGMVNFVTKRAGKDDLTRLTLTNSGKSMMGAYFDLARRFGRNKDWGARIMAEKVDGETAVDGQKVKSASIYINLDHEGEKSKTNFFTGYRQNEVVGGQRWFKLGSGVTRFPSVPKASRNYAFDGMDKASYGWLMALNHEQKFSKDWKWFLNAGTMENKLNQNVMYRFSAITLLNDAGDFNLEQQQTTTPQKAHYVQLGVRGKLRAGRTEHDLTLAVDHAWRERSAAKAGSRVSNLGTGNIYTGIINQIRQPHTDYEPYLANRTKTRGLSFADSITMNKWNVLLGIHYHSSDVTAYNQTGRTTSRTIASATTPTYALTYRPTDKISVYGSHAEYFESGTIVGSAYVNNNAVLPPAKTKQNEIGVKYANKDLLYSLALFDIEQANNIRVDRGGLAYLEQNGKLRHRGIELGISGKIAPKWSLAFGAAYMNAFYDKTEGGRRDGVTEDGQPRWNGTLMAKYAADDKFSAFARMTYTGGAYILFEKFKSPATTVLDLGMTYRTKLGSVPTTFGLTVYNALNKEYWMVSRGDNNIYLSTPRTVALSMSMGL